MYVITHVWYISVKNKKLCPFTSGAIYLTISRLFQAAPIKSVGI
jgi:hypothetical protein